MKRLAASLLLVACLPFVGCNDQKTNPTPPVTPDRPEVDVQTPGGVEVKHDENGTKVRTPGADVDVAPKK